MASKKVGLFFILTLVLFKLNGQTCPDGLVYIHGNPIKAYDPSQPFVLGVNPYALPAVIMPTVATGGLGYGPNINAVSPSPTFYTVIANVFYYWNGSVWVNTGHSTSIGSNAGNIAVGPGCIYNFSVATGGIYLYDGTSNASLLFTIPGWFSSAGAVDLATDNCCNVYVMKTSAPQSLSIYSPSGVLTTSCTVSGMPSSVGGGGLAIVGNYVVTSLTSGAVYVGLIGGSSITFTNVAPNFGGGGGDLASCPGPCNSACFVTLPIEFLSFNCKKGKEGNSINWETAIEEDILFFEVQRSTDALNFQVIKKITALNKPTKYSIEDYPPDPNAIHYYKVVSQDLSGERKSTSICYSSPLKKEAEVSMPFPNPVINTVSMNIEIIYEGTIEASVVDKYGREIRVLSQKLESGHHKVEMDVSDVDSGVYILRIVTGGSVLAVKRFLKM